MPDDPRSLALDILVSVERDRAFADAELGYRLAVCKMNQPDRGLATNLVYGTLAWRLRIDTILESFLKRKLSALDCIPREILRMGLYQIAFLDRVPDYAAVNASVDLAKRRCRAAAGLVNAVLRRATREGCELPQAESGVAALAVRYSHPPWLVDLWLHELGEPKAVALMQADNRANPNVARALVDRPKVVKGAKHGRWAPDAWVLDAPAAAQTPFVMQSEASQLATLFLGVCRGRRILDACASPGGKAAYLGRLVGESGSVIALDPAPGSAARITASAAAGRVSNVEAREIPLQQLSPEESFDAVLVDAPCSGLGTLRQHPEIRWRRRPGDLRRLAGKQGAILSAAASHVRTGGRLVYSTCTLARVENDDVVERFLATHGNFREDHDASDIDAAVTQVVDEQGRLRMYPDSHDTDGFFAARFQKIAP